VQERLGHSSVVITLQLYTHVTPTLQADAAKQVANAIFA
jgi:integrase